MVEHQPSKLRVAGSSPVSRSMMIRGVHLPWIGVGVSFAGVFAPGVVSGGTENLLRDSPGTPPAHVAQPAEHFLGKEEVTGSSPVVGSRAGGVLRKNFPGAIDKGSPERV